MTSIRMTMATALATLLVVPAVRAEVRYEGLAYPAKGGALLYRETHWLYRDGGVDARLVLYRCPDGQPFARKRMRDVPSAIAPDFEFVDARTGYREGVRTRGGRREVFHRPRADARLKVQPLAAVPGLVIDAGFDAFVRTHWTRLERGGVTAPFLVPSRQGTLDFRVGDAATTTENGRAVRRLRMALPGVLGLAVPSIELTYDVATRRLLRFRGPGTVRDARGRLQALRVEFPEPPVRSGVARTEIDAAASVELATACRA